MEWKFKIKLKDEKIFKEIEKDYGININNDLKDFIKDNNAGSPSKSKFMVGTDEKIFGAVLSLNKNEDDVDSVFTALERIDDKNNFPFAIDPFGNYICLNLKTNVVEFLNHETNEVISTKKNIDLFIKSLY